LSPSRHEEFRNAARAVALGQLVAFRDQCCRLADLANLGIVGRLEAIDALQEIAVRHHLLGTHGVDFIQALLADAFRDRFDESQQAA
jgi:hypothetical protein